jgi:hypothetical protein
MKKRSTAKPYKGNEPYIFVSYCHKDRRFVLPVIESLVRTGYRIWYDEGIEPGSEWNEIIADHMSRSSLCMAFISENAVASHNCRREISYALQKNRPLLSVFLEETVLSPGIEMQLSAYQCLYAYELKHLSKCLSKIASVSAVKACLGKPNPAVKVRSPADYDEIIDEDKRRASDISDEWFTGKVHDNGVTTTIGNEWFTGESSESDTIEAQGEMPDDIDIQQHDKLPNGDDNPVTADGTDADIRLDNYEQRKREHDDRTSGEADNEALKRKNTKRRITAIITASCALICVTVLFIIWFGSSTPGTPPTVPPDTSPPPTAPAQIPGEQEPNESDPFGSNDTVIFTLYPPGYMSDAEFFRALTVITERVRSIADQYIIENDGSAITVRMLKDDLGTIPESIESTIAFIAGIGTFRIWNDASYSSMELSKDEILSVIVRPADPYFYIPEHYEWAFLNEAGINNISFIDITVTPGETERIHEIIGSGDEFISVSANDLIMDDISFYRINIGMFLPVPGTETEFRIVALSHDSNLIATSLMHFSLPERFNYTIHEEIIWQGSDSPAQGQFQAESITGDSITFLFEFSNTVLEHMTGEDFDNAVSIVKNRMDAIGNPYVIGTSTLKSRSIAIQTSPERLGTDFVSLIGGAGVSSIETAEFRIFGNEDISELIVNQISQDNYSLIVQLSDDIENYEEKAAFIINNTVNLYINSVLVSSAEITESITEITDRRITFSSLNFVSHIEMNERSRFILDLLSEIVNGDAITYTMIWEHEAHKIESRLQANLNLYSLDGNVGGFEFTGFNFRGRIDDIAWGVNCDSPEDALVREAIAEHFDDIVVHRPYGGRLNFLMVLEVNDDLPQSFLDIVEDIYIVCGFDNSTYLELYFINENTDIPEDRFRIIFRRGQINDLTPDDEAGLLAYTLLITGRTFERFINEMEYLLDSREFFRDKQRYYPN